MPETVRILGIDPGSQVTGFGIIDAASQQSRHVVSGSIRTRSKDFSARLREIHREIAGLMTEYGPGEIAIERVFVHRNADSALKLGHARAAALCATFSRELPIYEYAPREIKQAVVGKGSAAKTQVAHMVGVLLGIAGELQADAADALAVAICHGHARYGSRALNVAAAFGGRPR